MGAAGVVAAFALAGSLVFGGCGAALAMLAVQVSGRGWLLQFWLGFDVFIALCLVASYWLVGRYGLRFYDTAVGTDPVWRLATIGNRAWCCLPRMEREVQRSRLRALNAAARLLLTDPEDDRTFKALVTHAEVLRKVSTTVLRGRPESGAHGDAVLDRVAEGEYSSSCLAALTGGGPGLSLVPSQDKTGPETM
ncbi:hypothetical protein [Streptomyces sp. NPDC055709]